VRDIDTAVVDSLKVLDPNRPIREATEDRTSRRSERYQFRKSAALFGHVFGGLQGKRPGKGRAAACPYSGKPINAMFRSSTNNELMQRSEKDSPVSARVTRLAFRATSRSVGPERCVSCSTLFPIPLYTTSRLAVSRQFRRQLSKCRWITTEQNCKQLLPPRKMKWLA
jgi:hypothetical protein